MSQSVKLFLLKLEDLLKEDRSKEALKEILDVNNHDVINEAIWDLIPQLSTYLTDKRLTLKPDCISDCEKAICHICKEANPKELLIIILEQIDLLTDDTKFKTLLKPLQIVLLQLPNKRLKSLELTFSTLYNQVKSLPIPQEQYLEGKEKLLYDLDPNVRRIGNVTLSLLFFVEVFVKELAHKSCQIGENLHLKDQESRDLIVHFLFNFLDMPLVYLDLEIIGKSKSSQRLCSEKIMQFMRNLISNFALINERLNDKRNIKNFTKTENKTDNYYEASSESDLAVACFSYLSFGEELELDHWPAVYSLCYIFESNLQCACILLKQPQQLIINKGIILLSKLMNKIEDSKFDRQYLEFVEFSCIPNLLISIMITSRLIEIRQNALKLLLRYLNKFTVPARYWIINILLSIHDHSGIRGILINFFKNDVHYNLDNPEFQYLFTGLSLKRILKLILKLPEGVETDILNHLDSILGTLNFIRYFLIRDKPENDFTGIWELLPEIEGDFLNPLRIAVDMSRAHYELEIRQLEEQNKGQHLVNNDKCFEDINHNHQILHDAILVFAMIESVMGRVNELIAGKL